jgi:hypothetical protein
LIFLDSALEKQEITGRNRRRGTAAAGGSAKAVVIGKLRAAIAPSAIAEI